MFKILDYTEDELIAIEVEGEIRKEDYKKLNPLVDKTVRDFGIIKFLILINTIDAIKPEALVSDVKMYLNHYNHIRKAAVAGDKTWQRIIAGIANPFISGKLKYFSKEQLAEALQWVKE